VISSARSDDRDAAVASTVPVRYQASSLEHFGDDVRDAFAGDVRAELRHRIVAASSLSTRA
jgi:hypothetical protein